MKIGIVFANLPGADPSALEMIGQPAPYRDALDTYSAAIADPEVAAKYSGIALWTKTGIAKKRKLRGVVPVPVEEKKPVSKKQSGVRKRPATKNDNK